MIHWVAWIIRLSIFRIYEKRRGGKSEIAEVAHKTAWAAVKQKYKKTRRWMGLKGLTHVRYRLFTFKSRCLIKYSLPVCLFCSYCPCSLQWSKFRHIISLITLEMQIWQQVNMTNITAVGDNESCILILNLIKQLVRIYFSRQLIETVETVNRPVDCIIQYIIYWPIFFDG